MLKNHNYMVKPTLQGTFNKNKTNNIVEHINMFLSSKTLALCKKLNWVKTFSAGSQKEMNDWQDPTKVNGIQTGIGLDE